MFIAKICLKYITFRQILLFLDTMNTSWIRFRTVVLYGAKQTGSLGVRRKKKHPLIIFEENGLIRKINNNNNKIIIKLKHTHTHTHTHTRTTTTTKKKTVVYCMSTRHFAGKLFAFWPSLYFEDCFGKYLYLFILFQETFLLGFIARH